MTTPDAFFVPEGERWLPTQHTVSPWGPDHLHGGPVAALLARAAQRLPADGPQRLVRLHLDFLRPVPKVPLTLSAEVVRASRSTQRVALTLHAGDKLLCTAQALRARTEQVGVDATLGSPPAAPPEGGTEGTLPVAIPWPGYHLAVEIRVVRGGLGTGEIEAWMRPLHPVVLAEAPTPEQTTLVVADAASGVASRLDWRRWRFLNADLDVVFTRTPPSGWVCLDAVTELAADGLGTCSTILRDARGPVGRSTQLLLVQRSG